MRFFARVVVLAVVLSAPASAQSGSEPNGLAPDRQFNLDLAAFGLQAGFVSRQSPNTAFGVSIGVGGNWANYMLLGGRHFAEEDGFAYDKKDGNTGKSLSELLRASVFVRKYFNQGRSVDVGLKASGFMHFDSSDDEPGGGIFVGVTVAPMWWQWKKLRLGSELDMGVYSEPSVRELGVNVAPVLVRVVFP